MNDAIREVIALTHGEVAKNGVVVRTQLADGLPLIQGDRVQLQQVILNLIINAVEAMSRPSDGARELLISTAPAGAGGVRVAVRDSGPGLDPAKLERLFEAFYTTKPGGMGMGLSICRSIIEAHGGQLWAEANDRGARSSSSRCGRETMLTRRDAMKGLIAVGAGVTAGMSILSEALGNDEIAVASLFDATGPINIYGRPMIDATAFAVDNINASGGVLSKKLRLIQLDTQSDNDVYAQYALQVILRNRVAVLTGGITSASRETMRPVVDKYKEVFFYPEQYEGGVCDKYVFCTGATPAQQLSLLVPWSIETYGKTFYTLAADYNYGHVSADWVKKYLTQAGGGLVGEEFIPLDVVDFDSVIQRVEQKEPAVVMPLRLVNCLLNAVSSGSDAVLADAAPWVAIQRRSGT